MRLGSTWIGSLRNGVDAALTPVPLQLVGGGRHPGGLDPRLRRYVLWGACGFVPAVVVAGSAVTTPGAYVVALALASAPFTVPALVLTWIAGARARPADRPCYRLWLAALVIMHCMGLAAIATPLVAVRSSTAVNVAAVGAVIVLVTVATVLLVRSRSGRRALSVDLVDSVMSCLVVLAPLGLLWGGDVVDAEAPWFAVPSAVATGAMVFGLYWAVLFAVRTRPVGGSGPTVGTVGVAFAAIGMANTLGQTAQGVTGFALPSGPLLGLHVLCTMRLMLMPLYLPRAVSPGLERLAPQAQVRGAWLPAGMMASGLAALAVTTVALRDRVEWAAYYSLAVTGALLLLGAARQLVVAGETRRLYAQVAQAAANRRELLAHVVQRSDEDRHRVAAELHGQAVSAYATFVSFLQSGTLAGPPGAGAGVAGASEQVRGRLHDQAEGLRRLMLAVQPIDVERRRAQSLGAPIYAYIDALYGDAGPPEQEVVVDHDLVLDWPTETVVLRIVHEAVRNVWRHSAATCLSVTVRAEGAAVEVTVEDDGVGFDPSSTAPGAGLAAMQSFAGLARGSVEIDSAPGRGARVTALLGAGVRLRDDQVDTSPPEPAVAPRLRLVQGGAGAAVPG